MAAAHINASAVHLLNVTKWLVSTKTHALLFNMQVYTPHTLSPADPCIRVDMCVPCVCGVMCSCRDVVGNAFVKWQYLLGKRAQVV
jgi:hypothetical protein